ncbi:hypothetical protein CDL15_Pgr004281 [Punica granatum]|uniref:non-specific serine/threonine protein kinase n=1 Tax=Punica granatum TaxID=22663 RepID=A0A218XGH2_PUNGR|nr:hypothetical protein CDL15_Pgr004281 [Punica granatum]
MESHLQGWCSAATFWLLQCITAISLAASLVSSAQRTNGNETDWLALLEFKANIIDPLGVLSSWNSTHHFCQWHGVTCWRRHQRVTVLNLQSQMLLGTLSPHIGNLSFLRVLNLQNNSFRSRIPPEVGHLSRLQFLSLNNNSLNGPIPPSLVICSNLVGINLHSNMLEGNLPSDLGFLSKLTWLSLDFNDLSGTIPLSVGNLSSMEAIRMQFNNFEGKIPDTLSNLRNLKVLDLTKNNLVGNFPSSITNISSLEYLDLGDNQLVGILPWDLGIILPKLKFLSVGYNRLTGSIPKSLSNVSSLSSFQVVRNNFTGQVPSFGKMSDLLRFSIGQNNLGSGQANDLNFLCPLTNSTNLYLLGIRQNNFGGSMPECTVNLSITLARFWLDGNVLSGGLLSSIGNLKNLEVLSLSSNSISGIIPHEIGNLNKMKELYLDSCEFTGQIPHTLGNLTMMTHLYLQRNSLQGIIPFSLSKCQNLLLLDLADNKLTGAIPAEIVSLSSLSIYADFSKNNLSGELPMEIGNLKNLGALRLYGNKLSGEIPSTLGSCMSLEVLYMQENIFTSLIPSTLSSLKGIQELNLSHNRLSGQIPKFFKDLNLSSLDLSFNNFEGNLPMEGVFANTSATSVLGNVKLCGGLPEYQLPKCKPSRSTHGRLRDVSIYTVPAILAIAFVLSLLYALWCRKERRTVGSGYSFDGLLKVSYQDLLNATDQFSSANLIGTGSFGSVFKGVLGLYQTTIAVKVFNLTHQGASKSFIVECEAQRNIRHRNLVKVLTACSGLDYKGNDFKALVNEFMENGSLDQWLHPEIETGREWEDAPRILSLLQRVNIAIDVACAIDYLHHQCETTVVHCDLKPNNILLDREMNGRVGDFGLVRFLPKATREFISNQTNSFGVGGSLGYIAPEYGAGAEVSTDGDVYSYGILILEMFTGKRPTDDMLSDGLNLHSFAKAAIPERVLQIIDPVLLLDEDNNQDISRTWMSHDEFLRGCLVSILEIGIICSSEAPRDRMRMSKVVAVLQAIREMLLGSRGN